MLFQFRLEFESSRLSHLCFFSVYVACRKSRVKSTWLACHMAERHITEHRHRARMDTYKWKKRKICATYAPPLAKARFAQARWCQATTKEARFPLKDRRHHTLENLSLYLPNLLRRRKSAVKTQTKKIFFMCDGDLFCHQGCGISIKGQQVG